MTVSHELGHVKGFILSHSILLREPSRQSTKTGLFGTFTPAVGTLDGTRELKRPDRRPNTRTNLLSLRFTLSLSFDQPKSTTVDSFLPFILGKIGLIQEERS